MSSSHVISLLQVVPSLVYSSAQNRVQRGEQNMSDQVSAQFRKWVGLDIAMEQMVYIYTVWSVYYKHCNIERVILIALSFVLITTQRCPLITFMLLL